MTERLMLSCRSKQQAQHVHGEVLDGSVVTVVGGDSGNGRTWHHFHPEDASFPR